MIVTSGFRHVVNGEILSLSLLLEDVLLFGQPDMTFVHGDDDSTGNQRASSGAESFVASARYF